jgi:outer membrane protein assembly factor BamB
VNDAIISGVAVPRATTSCSALALFVGAAALALAAQPASSSPSSLALFPVHQAWTEPLGKVVTTPPAFDGTRAFFPVEGGEIQAFDLGTGTPDWTAAGAPLSMPATGGGLLYFVESDAIAAVRQDTGHIAWRLPIAVALAVPLVWDNGWLVAADVTGTLLAFRASDGALIWRQELGAPVHAPPALAADRVYAPLEDGRVIALEVASGTRVWERRLGGPANDMLALDDRVYVGSDDNFLYCLHASSGEIAWRWRTGGDVIGQPVADDDRVYFVSLDNVLRGLDRRSGSQRWKRALSGRPARGPIRSGSLLLVSGVAPRVNAFAMSDGSPAGDIAAPGEIAAAPYVLDVHAVPRVIVVARDVARGTRVVAYTRTIDPLMDTPLPPLPGAIAVAVPKPDPREEPGSDATSDADRKENGAGTPATKPQGTNR